MDLILRFLENNPWINLLSISLAILGVAATTYFFYKGKRMKSPCFSFRSFNIIRASHKNIENLTIKFDNKEIDNLTISKLAFWNSGNETIDRNDIATKNPLYIINEDDNILQADIIYQKNSSNNFSISVLDEKIKLEFDYIDKNEGVVVQIYHKNVGDFKIIGNLKGVKEIKSINPKLHVSGISKPILYLGKNLYSSKFRFAKIVFFFIFPLIPILLSPSKFFNWESMEKISFSIFYFITIGLYWLIGIYFYKRKVPVEFDMILNNKTAHNNV